MIFLETLFEYILLSVHISQNWQLNNRQTWILLMLFCFQLKQIIHFSVNSLRNLNAIYNGKFIYLLYLIFTRVLLYASGYYLKLKSVCSNKCVWVEPSFVLTLIYTMHTNLCNIYSRISCNIHDPVIALQKWINPNCVCWRLISNCQQTVIILFADSYSSFFRFWL